MAGGSVETIGSACPSATASALDPRRPGARWLARWLPWAAPVTTGTQSQSAITGDNSANPSYAYDGLLTTALKPGSNAYVNVMPTGSAGTGTPLSASGRGSVTEIDIMFQKMWDNFQVSPTVLYVNLQKLKNITAKVLSNSSGPLLRYESPADGSANEYQLTASGVVQFYYNPFT